MYRRATAQDCQAVYRLICEMEGKRLAFDSFRAIYQQQMDSQAYVCLVWERAGEVVGVLNLRLEKQLHHAARIAEIMELAVAPAARGQGVGTELLRAARRLARARGCAQIEVACNQLRADAHRFYGKAGLHNFHYKFSQSLLGDDTAENAIGK